MGRGWLEQRQESEGVAMRSGRTSKPCHGCGNSDPIGRGTDSVCGDCLKLLADGKKYRKQLSKNCDLLPCITASRSFDLPYIHNGSSGFKQETDFRKHFQTAYLELVQLIGIQPSDSDINTMRHHKDAVLLPNMPDNWRGLDTPILLTSEAVKLFDSLYKAADSMVQYAYDEGTRDGKRFLSQLIRGEVAMSDLQDGASVKGK
jgi:hypothetical protein